MTGTVPVKNSLLTGSIFFLKKGKEGDWEERGREGVGGAKGNFPLASVGSRAWGNNRKRTHSSQSRVGPNARLTASAPAPGSHVELNQD